MDLTDLELIAMHTAMYNEVYYGDDWIVYAKPGHSGYVDSLRSGLEKLDAEIERRNL